MRVAHNEEVVRLPSRRVMGEIRYLHLIVPWQVEPESTLVETLNLALEQGRCGAHPKVVENLPITSIHAPTILDAARLDLDLQVDEITVVRNVVLNLLRRVPVSVDDLGAVEIFAIHLEQDIVTVVQKVHHPFQVGAAGKWVVAAVQFCREFNYPGESRLVIQHEPAASALKPPTILAPALRPEFHAVL